MSCPSRSPRSIPGHQIVGEVDALGAEVTEFNEGDRIGIPWLGGACGRCTYCRSRRENLCDSPVFTGYQVDGGYAEYAVARAAFAFPIPVGYDDVHAAPLLCAGLIGYRALMRAEVEGLDGPARLGLFGFGSSAQIVIQVARHLGHEIHVYTRGKAGQERALELGAAWAGGGEDRPPAEFDSAIIFAPAGELVPKALSSVRKGGVVVCAGIHMSPIPQFDYELLWGERTLRSVANLTRRDGQELLAIAARWHDTDRGRGPRTRAGQRGARRLTGRRARGDGGACAVTAWLAEEVLVARPAGAAAPGPSASVT